MVSNRKVVRRTRQTNSNKIPAPNVCQNTTANGDTPAIASAFENAGLPDTLQEPMALLYLDRTISLQADMLAFRGGFLLLAIVTLAAVLPAWFMRPKKQPAIPAASAQAAG